MSLNAPRLTWQPRRALIRRACWPESVPAKEAKCKSAASLPGGPEAAAAGGKKTGGGTTSGSGSGTTGTGTGAGQGTTTTVLHDIPLHWQTLSPPTGDTGLPTDPWFANWQWSLTNPTTGIDVIKAWQNYTGLGVKIGIVDDGIDYNHPDLNPHYLFNLQYDAVTADGSAYGNPSSDFHGTTVAGVLAAARDGSGIVGVAYNAGIAGDRISYSTGGASQLADALNHLATNGFDIDGLPGQLLFLVVGVKDRYPK